MGWYGVDLDGTLAYYDGWEGIESIGDPIPAMADRVKGWLEEGREVRIVTGRVHGGDRQGALPFIQEWCERHFGVVLPVTNEKDNGMIELWDDRVVQVETNTGRLVASAARLGGPSWRWALTLREARRLVAACEQYNLDPDELVEIWRGETGALNAEALMMIVQASGADERFVPPAA